MFIIFIILVLFVLLICLNIKVVPQSEKWVIERLGVYQTDWTAGVHMLFPLIDRIANKVTLKEIVLDFKPQSVITKDNVTMQIDSVVYMQITDPKLYTYGVVNPINAVENLTATSLRNVIGEKDLDDTLSSRDEINTKMCNVLDLATDPWGIKVTRVEVKNIIPPHDIQEAMEKQMRAEREKREAILRAEGEKQSAILTAQGRKDAAILKAEADKETLIKEAEGKAESMRIVFEAQAKSIELINKANPSNSYLTLETLKAYEKMADGKSTKIIIPQNMQDVATSLTVAQDLLLGKESTPEIKK